VAKLEQRDLHVGDTRTAISARLVQEVEDPETGEITEEPVNLQGKTVQFKMVRPDGSLKLAATASNVQVTDEPGGEAQYLLQAADVDEQGTFFGYFIVTDSGKSDHFPVERRLFELRVHGDA